MTLKAVVKYGLYDGAVELREMPEPEIGDDEVLLETKAAGVCGSDVEFWRHKITYPINVPVILGHEFCGVIAKVGKNVTGWKEGERVVCETAYHVCGRCEFCRSGEYNLCPKRLGFGYGVNGAFTRFVRVPQRLLHRLPDNIPFEHAALTEPLCVAYNALVVKSRIKPADLVVIMGPGAIGLMCLQIAKVCGAITMVCGLSIDEKRLEAAKRIGADYVVNVEQEDPVAKAKELTDGIGAPLVVDAAGANAALRQAIEIVKPNGQITKIAWNANPPDFSLDLLVAKAATLQGTYSHTWRTWEAAIKLMSEGKVNMDAMISHKFPITDWHQAFELVEERQAVKAVLYPVD